MGVFLIICGSFASALGTAWLLVVAAMLGWVYFFGMLIVPCFQYYLLFVEPRKCAPPIFLQLFGGMLAWSGAFVVSMEQPEMAAEYVPMGPGNDADPVLPGSYVPPPTVEQDLPMLQQFLLSVDPMLFSAAGGALVFLFVGTVVGTILLWNVGQQEQTDAEAA